MIVRIDLKLPCITISGKAEDVNEKIKSFRGLLSKLKRQERTDFPCESITRAGPDEFVLVVPNESEARGCVVYGRTNNEIEEYLEKMNRQNKACQDGLRDNSAKDEKTCKSPPQRRRDRFDEDSSRGHEGSPRESKDFGEHKHSKTNRTKTHSPRGRFDEDSSGSDGGSRRNSRDFGEHKHSKNERTKTHSPGGRFDKDSYKCGERSPRGSRDSGEHKHSKNTRTYSPKWKPKDGSSDKDGKRGPDKYTFKTAEGLEVKLYRGSIVHRRVDAIVNAANEKLDHCGGVAKVISDAAGNKLESECRDVIRNRRKINVSENCVTGAGNLPCKYVIHAVGPSWHDYRGSPDMKTICLQDVAETVKKILFRAEKKKFTTVVMPPISSGE